MNWILGITFGVGFLLAGAEGASVGINMAGLGMVGVSMMIGSGYLKASRRQR